ncbi:MAG: hypothetical protein JJT89_15540 [Nitriliruptoraceae bacterium]|nr:hypothetical protein [Nitriliruptoraceae bacterium]
MDLSEGDARRHHPFGRLANVLVIAGSSLAAIQAVVAVLAVLAAPANDDFQLESGALLTFLVVAGGLHAVVGWLAVRSLRAWWRRSLRVVNQLLVAGLVAMPSTVLLQIPVGGDVGLLWPLGYLPGGVLLVAGALVARDRVDRARIEGRGGLSER